MQVISFYIIALLYMKVSKFDDLERRQNKLMKEMDNAISAYLFEVKEENDKLIEKLSPKVNEAESSANFEATAQEVHIDEQQKAKEEPQIPVTIPEYTMRNHARKSYETIQKSVTQSDPEEDLQVNVHNLEEVELDDRTRALRLSEAGLSVEEIAKKLNKGRTEIELILKFN